MTVKMIEWSWMGTSMVFYYSTFWQLNYCDKNVKLQYNGGNFKIFFEVLHFPCTTRLESLKTFHIVHYDQSTYI